MLQPNKNYANLKDSYLFYNIAQKTKAYTEEHPGTRLYRMGIGDVSQPLCDAVIQALHQAVDDQADPERFHGYMPECGDPAVRKVIAEHYAKRGVILSPEEVFVSSGASDELGDLQDLFDKNCKALVIEPAYPAYVDACVMAGREILHVSSGKENGFLPMPEDIKKQFNKDSGQSGAEGILSDDFKQCNVLPELIYICSPNNPTGAVYSKEQLKQWVDFANNIGAVILFDAAYEAFIEDPDLPHSIFEIDGAISCAIEICSLSKTAGFTGTRMGYTVIPSELERNGMNLNSMWVRNRTTKTNGVSYILQQAGAAIFTEEGQEQIRKTIQIYKNNAKVLMDALDRCGIWYCGGKNAPYIWLECPDGFDSWEFFDYLLEKIQVVGTPGEGFGSCGKNYFRFSTFGSPEDTREAAARIVRLLR